MVLEGLCPEEQEWLVRKAALAGGMGAIATLLVRQAVAFEGAYYDLQAVHEISSRLRREGVLARDARRRRRRARSGPAWSARVERAQAADVARRGRASAAGRASHGRGKRRPGRG